MKQIKKKAESEGEEKGGLPAPETLTHSLALVFLFFQSRCIFCALSNQIAYLYFICIPSSNNDNNKNPNNHYDDDEDERDDNDHLFPTGFSPEVNQSLPPR